MVDLLRANLRPGDVFFDIGAWVGPFSIFAARRVGAGGCVYAFEPDPDAELLLEANLQANHVTNVKAIGTAVCAEDGATRLERVAPGGDMRSHIGSGAAGSLVTQGITLASFCAVEGVLPDVVKIDVEGTEDLVLAGAGDTLRSARLVVLEVHPRLLAARGIDADAFLVEEPRLAAFAHRRIIARQEHTFHIGFFGELQ